MREQTYEYQARVHVLKAIATSRVVYRSRKQLTVHRDGQVAKTISVLGGGITTKFDVTFLLLFLPVT